MAEKKIGARIVLEGEADYKRAIKEINAEQKELRSELKLCAAEFDGQKNSLDALTKQNEILTKQYEVQSRKVDEYNKMLEQSQKAQDTQGAEVERLKKTLEDASKAYDEMKKSGTATDEELAKQEKLIADLGAELELAEKRYDNVAQSTMNWQTQVNNGNADLKTLENELATNNKYLDEAKNSTDGCAKSIDEFGKEVKKADEDTKDFGKDTKEAFDALSQALVSAGIVKGVQELSAVLMDCVESADRFGTSVAKVTTVADMGVTTYSELSRQIMNTSNEIGIMSTDIAEATYQAISAGVETGRAVQFAGEASKLAVAGFTDSATAVDIMTTALNAYGMSAEESIQVSNQLLIAQNLGKTTVEELAGSLGKVIPTAAASSVNFANLATSMAVMTANGIKTRFAITDMNALLNELSDEGSDASEVLKNETGKSFEQLMASGKSLGDVLNILSQNCDENGKSLKNLFSNSTAGTAALSLMSSGVEKFNSVLNEMETNTDATSKAFETMSGTSEYATQRMEVAVDNLKIAIGDELSPALTNATKGVTSITEAMTEFISNNEWLVDVVASLVSAITVLVTGIGGYIAVTKAAEIATAALTAVMKSNPAVLMASAIGALAVGIGSFVAIMGSAHDSTSQLNKEFTELSNNVEESKKNYEDNAKSISTNANVAQGLVSKIQKLNSAEKLSASQKIELKNAVDQLNALYPSMGLQIDSVTGKIIGETDAIESNLDALVKKQRIENNQERINEIIQEQIQYEDQLAEVKDKAAAAQDRYTEAVNAGQEANFRFTDEELEAMAVAEEAQTQIDALGDEYAKLTGETDDLNNELNGVTDAMNGASDANENYNETLVNTINGTVAVKGATEEQEAAIINLGEAYNKAQADARASLDSQVGLFEKLSNKSDLSTKEIKDNLQSQVDVMKGMRSDLDTLQGRLDELGLPDDIMTDLAGLGVDGAGYINQLADASKTTDDQLMELVNTFEEVNTAKDELSAGLATWSEEVQASISSLAETANGGQVGTTIVTDIVNGITGSSKEIKDAGEKVVKEAQKTMVDATKNFDEAGKEADNKVADGVDKNSEKVEKAVKTVAKEAQETAKEEFGSDEFVEAGEKMCKAIAKGIANSDAIQKAIQAAVKKAIDAAKKSGGEEDDKNKEEGGEQPQEGGGGNQSGQSLEFIRNPISYAEVNADLNRFSQRDANEELARMIADSISDNVQIRATFAVEGDTNNIFRVVRKEANTYRRATGRGAF